jgi:hypothetical protein
MKKFTVKHLSICIAASVAFHAHAAPTSACVLEGKLLIGAKLADVKDCVQKNDDRMTEAMLQQACDGLSNAGRAFGGSPAKITYLAACPSNPQGSCTGISGGALSFSYYKRSPTDLAETKTSCAAVGGIWK